MLKDYLQRYLALDKCHLIRDIETCKCCGWELTATHETDFAEGAVVEEVACPHCHKTRVFQRHLLH